MQRPHQGIQQVVRFFIFGKGQNKKLDMEAKYFRESGDLHLSVGT